MIKMKGLAGVLLVFVCCSVLFSNGLGYGVSYCDCYCGPYCKQVKHYIPVGGGQLCYCTCDCSDTSRENPIPSPPTHPQPQPTPSPPLPPPNHSTPPSTPQQPTEPNPPTPKPKPKAPAPPANDDEPPHHPPAAPQPPPPTYYYYDWPKCVRATMAFGGCSKVITEHMASGRPMYNEIREACCESTRDYAGYCLGHVDYARFMVPFDLTAYCS